MNERRPILVTGSHRSGTTWVGSMLALATDVAHIHEPMNPVNRLSWLGMPPRRWFLHIDDDNAAKYLPAFQRMMALRPPVSTHLRTVRSARNLAANVRELGRAARWRSRHARPMVKDPIAFFSAEWLARTFDMHVVVLVRHPAAFTGSLKRNGWQFDFTNFTAQPRLIATYLPTFEAEIVAAAKRRPDLVDQAVLLWRCINSVVVSLSQQHPDWLVVRYEDLAADPVAGTRSLYHATGLPWSTGIATRVGALCSPGNPSEVAVRRTRDVRRNTAAALWTWQHRLSAEEVVRVRSGTADVAAGLYTDADWARPGELVDDR